MATVDSSTFVRDTSEDKGCGHDEYRRIYRPYRHRYRHKYVQMIDEDWSSYKGVLRDLGQEITCYWLRCVSHCIRSRCSLHRRGLCLAAWSEGTSASPLKCCDLN